MAINRNNNSRIHTADPLWYKDAIIYELHVRAFMDSDGDGIGDFKGLTAKLDYIQQLGVTAVWLLPFYPSPLRDDGYDIAGYADVNGIYGNLQDFRQFLREAHRRGIHVITELVINHTSDQHAWFQRARRAPRNSSHRKFYVWSDTPDHYADTRIIFKDFEHSNWTWDPVAGQYYWHRFYSHQPDLNFDHPATCRAVNQVMDFWFGMGVDGMRIDAIPYLFEREGTSCENLPETHAYMKELRRHLDRKFSNCMLLAEANQWPEDAAAYFGSGDECHMNFHFPLMPRLFMAIQMEDRYPIIDILNQTPAIPDNCQWALFLRNHDELTLEMVTDEERDYMYRVYAYERQARINLGIRRRLAPLLANNRRRIELMYALLFSLPGTPVIYYGDELGMGDNIHLGDRDGVRTPMQWSFDRNAGFSRANPQKLYLPVIIDPEYHYETVNVESQFANEQSLLNWVRRLIALRKRFQAFGRGGIEFLHPENRKVLAFIREYQDERILFVANLSRYTQFVQLDLKRFSDIRPIELFGRVEFPPLSAQPYMLTLGPHSFYYFELPVSQATNITAEIRIPEIHLDDDWEDIFAHDNRKWLFATLGKYLQARRWFRSKSRSITDVATGDWTRIPYNGTAALLTKILVRYLEGEPEFYLLPFAFSTGQTAATIERDHPHAVVAKLIIASGEIETKGILFDAFYDPNFARELLSVVRFRRKLKWQKGISPGRRTGISNKLWQQLSDPPVVKYIGAEQSNSSVIYDDKFILKVYRQIQEGINPDLELGGWLTEKNKFPRTPMLAGWLNLEELKHSPVTFATLWEHVRNEGDAWSYTLDQLDRFLDRVFARQQAAEAPLLPSGSLLHPAPEIMSPRMAELIGGYAESARVIGELTAQMHLALASNQEDAEFKIERFNPFYRRSLYQSLRNLTEQVMPILKAAAPRMFTAANDLANWVVQNEENILHCFHSLVREKIAGNRIRVHGDYHLGQLLFTGRDFVVVDFEGEPTRSLEERRVKRSPLRDVAGMLRSLDYAAATAYRRRLDRHALNPAERARLKKWAGFWSRTIGSQFLNSYLSVVRKSDLLGCEDDTQVELLLRICRLEKAIYEVGYELNNRPDWVEIPLEGVCDILSEVSN